MRGRIHTSKVSYLLLAAAAGFIAILVQSCAPNPPNANGRSDPAESDTNRPSLDGEGVPGLEEASAPIPATGMNFRVAYEKRDGETPGTTVVLQKLMKGQETVAAAEIIKWKTSKAKDGSELPCGRANVNSGFYWACTVKNRDVPGTGLPLEITVNTKSGAVTENYTLTLLKPLALRVGENVRLEPLESYSLVTDARAGKVYVIENSSRFFYVLDMQASEYSLQLVIPDSGKVGRGRELVYVAWLDDSVIALAPEMATEQTTYLSRLDPTERRWTDIGGLQGITGSEMTASWSYGFDGSHFYEIAINMMGKGFARTITVNQGKPSASSWVEWSISDLPYGGSLTSRRGVHYKGAMYFPLVHVYKDGSTAEATDTIVYRLIKCEMGADGQLAISNVVLPAIDFPIVEHSGLARIVADSLVYWGGFTRNGEVANFGFAYSFVKKTIHAIEASTDPDIGGPRFLPEGIAIGSDELIIMGGSQNMSGKIGSEDFNRSTKNAINAAFRLNVSEKSPPDGRYARLDGTALVSDEGLGRVQVCMPFSYAGLDYVLVFHLHRENPTLHMTARLLQGSW